MAQTRGSTIVKTTTRPKRLSIRVVPSRTKRRVLDRADAAAKDSVQSSPFKMTTSKEDASNHAAQADGDGENQPTFPYAGSTYFIRHRDTGKLIVVEEGRPSLKGHLSQVGIHWACVESDGWLGFRNTISGCYLARNHKDELGTDTPTHNDKGYFVVKPDPRGGQEVMVLQNQKLWRVTVADDHATLVLTEGKGAAWDFVWANQTGSEAARQD